jgi:transglutaminase-like putative cysteine protease
MRRQVNTHLELDVTEPALLALQIAVAGPAADEKLTATLDGAPVEPREVAALHGGRMHALDAERGHLVIDYSADVDGRLADLETSEYDLLGYRRPSRYCPSDRFLATAAAEFGAVEDPAELARSVVRWVNQRLLYLSGSSGPSDDAVDTLLLGEGVCRDYAHLVLALLRARDVPARLVAVYAPGLSPMDFHAVVEAWVDDEWRLLDATGLAPRASMLRIATGRDAADTAFLSVHHGQAELLTMSVVAVVDALPTDDPAETVLLG